MKKILYVLHSGVTGGTFLTNKDLMRNVEKNYEVYLLSAEVDSFNLYRFFNNELTLIQKYNRSIRLNTCNDENINSNQKWSAIEFHNSWLVYIYFDILVNFNIDIVHIRHLINHSFDLPEVAKKLGIPVVLSLHDFYFICPFYVLLDENNNYCGGNCNNNNLNCYCPMKSLSDINSKKMISTWRKNVLKMFSFVDYFVTTSIIVKNLFLSIYLDRTIINDLNFKVIEHGRDFPELNETFYEIPKRNKKVKILFPANNLNVMKGSELIKLIKKEDAQDILEFHFLGNCYDNIEEYGISHGTYERDDFQKKIAEIKPSFIGIFSIWPETFCHTLTEAWSCNIPVIGTNIGVIKDRILKNKGGWIIDRNNPKKAYNKILSIINDKEGYYNILNNVKNINFYSTLDMANKYLEIYHSLGNQRVSSSINNIDSNDFYKNYEIIKNSDLFDEKFYLNKYQDIKNNGIDALTHWIKYGFKESFRNPNRYFSNLFYSKYYLGDYTTWNALTHYVNFGIYEKYKRNVFDVININFSIKQINLILEELRKKVKIILLSPKFSSETINCINSIILKTNIPFDLILVLNEKLGEDDYSLIENMDLKNIKVMINSENDLFDFIKKIILKNNDYNSVILSSFVDLPQNWLRNLLIKAYSNEKINFVTPLSNFLINFSQFEEHDSNLSFSTDGLNFLIRKIENNSNLKIPYLDSYCTFVKRGMLKNLGWDNINYEFDNQFGSFLFELNQDKFYNAIDDSTYVHINNSNEIRFNLKNLSSYINNIYENLLLDEKLKKITLNINIALDFVNYSNLANRFLFVVEKNKFNNLILDFCLKKYECYFLIWDNDHIILKEGNEVLDSWNINNLQDSNDFKEIYFNILYSYKIDLIQINYILNEIMDLINIGKALNIPIILNCSNYLQLIDKFDETDHFKIFNTNEIIFNNKREYTHFASIFKDNLNFCYIDKSEIFEFEDRLEQNKLLPIKVLIIGYDSVDAHSIIHYSKTDNEFEFYFINRMPVTLNKYKFYYNYLDVNQLHDIINKIQPHFIVILNNFEEIHEVLYELSNVQIPILYASNNHVLCNIMKNFKNSIPFYFNSPNSLLNEIKKFSTGDAYYNLIKQFYLNDDDFYKNLLNIYNDYNNLYIKYENYCKLHAMNALKNYSKYTRKFFNFENFLIDSFTNPIQNYNNIKGYILDFMEDIINYLVKIEKNTINKPLVSIIMPVFNRKNLIIDSIQSILKQTYSNFELIIVDDGSTDGTDKVLNSLSDNRIKVICLKSNKGTSFARNQALKACSGEIISYLDSDNTWDSRYLSCIVGAFLELPQADALYVGQLLYNNSKSPNLIRFGSFNKSLIKNSNYIDLNCFSHKKQVYDKLGGFDSDLNRLIDWDLILKINNHFKIYSIPILISNYYMNLDEGITSYSSNNISIRNSNFEYISNILNKHDIIKSTNQVHSSICILMLNYSTINKIQSCIDSIIAADFNQKIEIIIYDNNFDEFTKSYLRNLENKKLITIIHKKESTFSNVLKHVLKISTSDYFILLNNIYKINLDSIEKIQNAWFNLDKPGIITPQELSINFEEIENLSKYANKQFYYDVGIVCPQNNIVEIPIFFDGSSLKIKKISGNCTYTSKEILQKFLEHNYSNRNYSDFNQNFSDYIRLFLKLNIYHIYDSKVYIN